MPPLVLRCVVLPSVMREGVLSHEQRPCVLQEQRPAVLQPLVRWSPPRPGATLGKMSGTPSSRRPTSGTHNPVDDRDESVSERADRNWAELLQELRVTQTGSQILTGFLVTLPFQQAFAELDSLQRGTYVTLLLLSVLATVLLVAPVAAHRVLFRRHLRLLLVREADACARTGLVVLGLVLTGVTFFLVDVIFTRPAALLTGAVVMLVVLALWLVGPVVLLRRARSAEHDQR